MRTSKPPANLREAPPFPCHRVPSAPAFRAISWQGIAMAVAQDAIGDDFLNGINVADGATVRQEKCRRLTRNRNHQAIETKAPKRPAAKAASCVETF